MAKSNKSVVRKIPSGRQLIWERIELRASSNSSNLTIGHIVRLAMEVADRDGLEDLSMRRLAAELNAGVMSLYYYVPAKGDLLDLLLDEALGEIQLPASSAADWQQDVRLLAVRTRACLKRHPWVLMLLNSRPALGPNRLAHLDFLIATLSRLGLGHKGTWRAMGSIFAYVVGFVTMELSNAHALRRATSRNGPAPYFVKLLGTGRYPALTRYFAAGPPTPPDDEGFEVGLGMVLEGVAVWSRPKRVARQR